MSTATLSPTLPLRNRRQVDLIARRHNLSQTAFRAALSEALTVLDRPAPQPKGAPRKPPASASTGALMIDALKSAEGGYYGPEEVMNLMGIRTRQGLEKRRARKKIVSWSTPSNRHFYPKWQFQEDGSLLPGVAEVLAALDDQGQWMIMQFFLARTPARNGVRILDLLREGRVAEAVDHAHANSRKARR